MTPEMSIEYIPLPDGSSYRHRIQRCMCGVIIFEDAMPWFPNGGGLYMRLIDHKCTSTDKIRITSTLPQFTPDKRPR